MRYIIFALALLATPGMAQDSPIPNAAEAWAADRTRVFDATEVDLADFRWTARPIIIFGDSPFDPTFQRQMELLLDRTDELAARDVVLITDTDPEALSTVRERLRPRSFMLALIGKDGEIKLRKPAPWDVREITRSIDKMPLRAQEMRDRQNLGQYAPRPVQ
jgi:hypothetical protein